MIQLTVLAETAKTLTVGWTPITGSLGYEYLVDGKRVANTWDPAVRQAKFGKPDAKPHVYSVRALAQLDEGSLQWPAVTPPPPNGWTIAVPQKPIRTITNPPGYAINLDAASNPMIIEDTIVQGGGNTAYLIQPGARGRTIRRCQAFDVAAGGANIDYGMHAVYAKAQNLTVEDFTATGSKLAADGLSVRFGGFLGQRCQLDGFAFALAVFGDDLTPGTVTWKQIRGANTNKDTGIWLDVNLATKMVYDIFCDDVQLTGPGGWFLRANASVFAGSVTIRNGCGWNGMPIHGNPSLVANVPAGKLTIQP